MLSASEEGVPQACMGFLGGSLRFIKVQSLKCLGSFKPGQREPPVPVRESWIEINRSLKKFLRGRIVSFVTPRPELGRGLQRQH